MVSHGPWEVLVKVFRIVLAAALPFASSADVPSRSPIFSRHQVNTRKMDGQDDEAERNYRRGVQFAVGEGVAKDYSAAARLYRKAAEAGYGPAQYDLGYLYEMGLGVERDLKQAATWYRKAADQGDPEAQNNLGTLYASGQGVARNDSEAVRWYRLAADQNDPEGTSNLGTMYLQGRGVERDFVQAFELFRRAAEQGYAAAQNNLALMYANGQAVARDYVWAYAWLDVASAEISGCAELRDRIGNEMTGEEIARARDLATRKREEVTQKGKESK
jgi:TPR repeat protein